MSMVFTNEIIAGIESLGIVLAGIDIGIKASELLTNRDIVGDSLTLNARERGERFGSIGMVGAGILGWGNWNSSILSKRTMYGPMGPGQFVTKVNTNTQRAFRWDWKAPDSILNSGFEINDASGLRKGPGVYFSADPVSSIKNHGPYLYSGNIPKNHLGVISFSSLESSNALRPSTWYNVNDLSLISDVVYLGERQ